MMFGMHGTPIPQNLPYASEISQACGALFPPLVAYSIACRESIIGELNGKWCARTVCSADGGHGIFQLTSYVPAGWDVPETNAVCAVRNWLVPDMLWWRSQIPGVEGDDLVRCIAASFNAGRGGAWKGHTQGSVDLYTSDNYAAGVLQIYHNLLQKGTP